MFLFGEVDAAESLGLEAGELDHLAPFFGFVGDDFCEVGGRARHAVAAQVGQPRLESLVGEARIDSLVELVDDLGRRALRRGDAFERRRLVAGQEFADRRQVRQRLLPEFGPLDLRHPGLGERHRGRSL